ncbi:MAG TPA: PLP-dependent aminotransferase family protein [Ktedonobacteraceae bacterium]|nr:PLP-dependent aminotransferase family protein [Ktedonobacteraceae bacterium]
MTSIPLPQGMEQNKISLLLGHPDPQTLLTPALRDTILRLMSSSQATSGLQYGPEQGTSELISFLVEKINREQGLLVRPENLMIVAGSTHAVDMIARLYAGAGSTMLVEGPTYADALHIFRDQQINLHSIPMDLDGLIPDELEKQVLRLREQGTSPGILYTIPNFHNPTGSTLTETRRREIIQLARRYNFLIVEDDVYRDLSFAGRLPASFYALAEGEGVLSICSFSKTLAPGLRLGWLLGSEEAIQRFVNCGTSQMGGGANPFASQIVATYCQSGAWNEHVSRVTALYKSRCDVALAALERWMPAGVSWTHPEGGFFIWVNLPQNIFARQVKQQAFEAGVQVAAGDGFFVNPADGQHNLRLAFSCASLEEIEAGIRILASVIADQ